MNTPLLVTLACAIAIILAVIAARRAKSSRRPTPRGGSTGPSPDSPDAIIPRHDEPRA